MIGKLSGIIDSISNDHIIVDVNGVGYLIFCSPKLLNQVTAGNKIILYIHTHVKEEQIVLYGFGNHAEKEWFLRLQEVQGVGAKMSIQILGSLAIDDIISAILSEDVTAFKQVSGIGPKLASRIVNELKSNKHITSLSLASHTASDKSNDNNVIMDAVSVLCNLGFNRKDAFVTVSNIRAENSNLSLEEVIKASLGLLSNSK